MAIAFSDISAFNALVERVCPTGASPRMVVPFFPLRLSAML